MNRDMNRDVNRDVNPDVRAAAPPRSPTPAAASRQPGDDTAATNPPRLQSADLFGAAREVLIEHESQLYRLRQTSLGKLILTK